MYLICGEAFQFFNPIESDRSESQLIIVSNPEAKNSLIRSAVISNKTIQIITFDELNELVISGEKQDGSIRIISDSLYRAIVKSLLIKTPEDYNTLVGNEGAPYLTDGVLSRIISALDQISTETETDFFSTSDREKQLRILFLRISEHISRNNGFLKRPFEKNVWPQISNNIMGQLFPNINTVIFYDFSQFTELELLAIRHISSLQWRVLVSLDYDPALADQVHVHLDPAYSKLYDIADQTLYDHGDLVEVFPEFTSSFQHQIKVPSVFRVQNRKKEVAAIATCIKSLLSDSADNESSILVAYPDNSVYEQLLQTALADYYLAPQPQVQSKSKNQPAFRLLTTINTITKTWNFNNLILLLNADSLDKLFLQSNEFSTASVVHELSYFHQLSASNTDEQIENSNEHINEEDGYANLPAWILSLLNKIPNESDQSTTIYPFDFYKDIIIKSHNLYLKFCGEKSIADWSNLIQDVILGKLQIANMSDPFFDLLSNKLQEFQNNSAFFNQSPLQFSEFFSLLKCQLPLYYDNNTNENYTINVFPFSRAVGMQQDYLFIPGLVDGEFPVLKSTQSSILEKIIFDNHHKELSKQRLLLRNLIKSSGKTLLFYPELDGQVELIRSQFIDELLPDIDWSNPETVSSQSIDNILMAIDNDEHIRNNSKSMVEKESSDYLRLTTYLEPNEIVNNIKFDETSMNACHNTEANAARNREIPTQYDGIIINPKLRESIYKRINDTVFPVTQLDTLNQCQFKYFVNSIISPNLPDSGNEVYSSQEFGTLLHAILADVLFEMNRLELKFDSPDKKTLLNTIYSIADKHINDVDLDNFQKSVMRKLIFGEQEKEDFLYQLLPEGKVPGYLYGWIKNETERLENISSNQKLHPTFFEVNFGKSDIIHPSLKINNFYSIKTDCGDVKIRGIIDRIDIGENHFTVIDYKTGSVPPTKQIMAGLASQLPVYTQIVGQILTESGIEKAEAGAYYYQMNVYNSDIKLSYFNNDYKESLGTKSKRGLNDEQYDYIKDMVRFRLGVSYKNIRDGVFHPSLFEDLGVCEFCDLQKICKRDSERLLRIFGGTELPDVENDDELEKD